MSDKQDTRRELDKVRRHLRAYSEKHVGQSDAELLAALEGIVGVLEKLAGGHKGGKD